MSNLPSDNLTTEDIDRINKEMIETQFVLSDFIYIELQLLKAMNIGKLIYLTSNSTKFNNVENEAIFTHFIDNLDNYNSRIIDTIVPYLPTNTFTQEDFDNIDITDQDVADLIYAYSPLTEFYKTFTSQLSVNINHSKAAKHNKRVYVSKQSYLKESISIQCTINTYPYAFSEAIRCDIAAFFVDFFKVDSVIISIDPKKIDTKTLSSYDEWYTYHTNSLLHNVQFKQELEKLKFSKKHYFSAFLFTSSEEEQYYKDIKQRNFFKEFTESILQLCSDFHYIPSNHLKVCVDDGTPIDAPAPLQPVKLHHEEEQLREEIKQHGR